MPSYYRKFKNLLGNGIGKIGYIRQRELEFSGKFISKKDLLREIDETIEIVIQSLNKITDEQLNENFPLIVWENETGMAYTIIHLHSHLNYHLGQINYHRRILDVAK